MVRLRSNRWYAADGQRRSHDRVRTQVAGTRRVLSLCFLLALTIVLMQKASDPRHVSNAFSALGVPLDDSKVALPASEVVADRQEQPALDKYYMATCRDMIPRLLEHLDSEQLHSLSRSWFAPPSALDVPNVSECLAGLSNDNVLSNWDAEFASVLSKLSSDGAKDIEIWREAIARLRREWRAIATVSIEGEEQQTAELTLSLTDFLDRRLWQEFEQSQPWRSGEQLAFYRMLQRAGKSQRPNSMDSGTAARLLTTDELGMASHEFQDALVRFRGSVRSVERIDRTYGDLEIEGYWSLWMRGSDNANQPIAIYAVDKQAAILEDLLAQGELPEIEVMGVVGKRLAYTSQSGIEVAPTLFAHSIIRFVDAPLAGMTASSDWMRQLGYAVWLGLLFAVLLLWPILRNWSRRSGRTLVAIFLVGFAVIEGHAQQAALNTSELQPPWASTNAAFPEKLDLLSQRLRVVLGEFQSDGAQTERRLRELNRDGAAVPDLALKVLQALNRFDWPSDLGEVSEGNLTLAPCKVQGVVRSALPAMLSEGQGNWFQLTDEVSVFRLSVFAFQSSEQKETEQKETEQSVAPLVLASSVPSQWQGVAQLWQPCQLDAVGLYYRKAGSVDSLTNPLCLLVRRPVWMPSTIRSPKDYDSSQLQPAVRTEWLELSQQGFDLANLDLIAENSQKAVQSSESSAFYGFVSTAQQLHSVPSQAAQVSMSEVFARKPVSVGRPVQWLVRLVAATVIKVESAEAQLHLGGDRYFQIDGFLELGNQSVNYSSGDATNKFEGEYPITIVAKDLGSLVPVAKIPDSGSWDIRKFAMVEGRYYRLWSFSSELMDRKSEGARQVAPLIAASKIVESQPPIQSSAGTIGWFGYALCLATIAVLAMILVQASKNQRRRRQTRHRDATDRRTL